MQANCQAGNLIATCEEADVPSANKYVGVPPPPHLRGTLMIGQRVAVNNDGKGFNVGRVIGYNQWWKKHNIRFGMNEEEQIELSKASEWHLLPKEEDALAGPISVDSTKKVDCEGLAGIWACAMQAEDDQVSTAAAGLLIEVYHGMSDIASNKEVLELAAEDEAIEIPKYELQAEVDLQIVKNSYYNGDYFEWKHARVVALLNDGKGVRLAVDDEDDQIVDLTTQHLDGFTEDSKRGPRLGDRDTFSACLPGINKYTPRAEERVRGIDCRQQLQAEILERLMVASGQRTDGCNTMALRCLKMLKKHFVAFQSHLKECSHGSNSRGQGVNLFFKRMDPTHSKRLRVHSKMTAADLHKECCKLFNQKWDWELMLNKKYYNDPNAVPIPAHSRQTLEEFGIVDGSKEYEIDTTLNSTNKAEQDDFSPMDIFVSENGEQKHAVLMELLGAGANDEMRAVAWELLQILPTCHALRQRIEEQPVEGQWTSMFGSEQGYVLGCFLCTVSDTVVADTGIQCTFYKS